MTYAATASRTLDVLDRKGASVTVTYEGAGTYDAATGQNSNSTSTAIAKGVILPFSQGLRKLGNTNIAIGDEQLLLSALTTAGAALTQPKVDDSVTVNGKDYTIVEVSPLKPDGATAILYDCTVRAAP